MKKNKLNTIKTSGFKTPKDYFSQVEDQILNEVHLIDKVEKSGFEVPDNYFGSIDESILNQLEPNNPALSFIPKQHFYYVTGIAASLLLLFAIYINQETTENFSADMVVNYFNDSDLDTYELAQLLSDAELLEDNFEITKTQYNEDNLETYLLENTDIEELLQ